MRAVAIIPARFASQRFPGKLLADRTGKPLIQHVYERAKFSKFLDRVVIATDDFRIAEAARRFGADYAMTRPDHPNGTSRIAEVAEFIDADVIVNVQGDEPEIDPGLIDLCARTLIYQPECSAATIAAPFEQNEDPGNPNIVKVVLDQRGRALYFSRALIPHVRDEAGEVVPLKHVGLYAYRKDFLREFISMEPTPLEHAEKLEQLRLLEHGHDIAVSIAPAGTTHHGIDTPEQYDAFVTRRTG